MPSPPAVWKASAKPFAPAFSGAKLPSVPIDEERSIAKAKSPWLQTLSESAGFDVPADQIAHRRGQRWRSESDTCHSKRQACAHRNGYE
jgi:hypothetical protein